MNRKAELINQIKSILDPRPTNTEIFTSQRVYEPGETVRDTDLFKWVGERGTGEDLSKMECEKIPAAKHLFIKLCYR